MRSPQYLFLALVLTSALARAEEPSKAEVDLEPAWSIGAGIGGSGLVRGVFSEINSSNDAIVFEGSIGAVPSFFIEHRLSSTLWLLGRASFDYSTLSKGPSQTEGVPPTPGAKPATTQQIDGSLTIGLRKIMLTMSRVQVSGYGSIGGGIFRSRTESVSVMGPSSSVTSLTTNMNYTGGATFGVMGDAFLTPNLALRLSTSLVGLSLTSSKRTSQRMGAENMLTTTPSTSIQGGFMVSPSIEVRLLF